MNANIDIKDFQEELELLSLELTATEAFLSTLWDKADFFEKLCGETNAKLYQVQKRCKELQESIKKSN